MPTKEEKEIIEAFMLSAARKAGVPIPTGETRGIEPASDFIFENHGLGIELTELARPADDDGFVPAAEESFHKQLFQMAQEAYYRGVVDAKPAHVIGYFPNGKGIRRDKLEMARALAEFVKANIHRANPVAGFSTSETPEGFGDMSIVSESVDWWCGECGGSSFEQIREQLAYRINDKHARVSQYRANLPKGAHVWLLIYGTVRVSRNMAIPHGIDEWKFPFDFDRVFWFDSLENRIAEIQRLECALAC